MKVMEMITRALGIGSPPWWQADDLMKFYVVQDTSIASVWDELVTREIPKLRTRPKGWRKKMSSAPEGKWTIAHVFHQEASPEGYERAGIPRPALDQLPAVFCVRPGGKAVDQQYNLRKAEQALDFIRARLD